MASDPEITPIATGYIERLLRDPPERIPFGPRTQAAFRELLEYRAQKDKTREMPQPPAEELPSTEEEEGPDPAT